MGECCTKALEFINVDVVQVNVLKGELKELQRNLDLSKQELDEAISSVQTVMQKIKDVLQPQNSMQLRWKKKKDQKEASC